MTPSDQRGALNFVRRARHVPRRNPLQRQKALGLTFAPLCAVALMNGLAWAQDSTLAQLGVEIDERLEVIAALPKTTPEELTEATELDEARAALANYAGALSSFSAVDPVFDMRFERDLHLLELTSRSIEISATVDSGILFEIDAIRGLYVDFGAAAGLAATAKASSILDEAVASEIVRFIGLGDARLIRGGRIWLTEYGKAADVFNRSAEFYRGALVLGLEQQEMEAIDLGVDQIPTEVVLPAEDPIAFEPYTIQAKIDLPADTAQLTLSVRAIEQAPAGSSDGAAIADAFQATIGIETLFDLPAGPVNCPITVEIDPFGDELRILPQGGPGLSSFEAIRTLDVGGDFAVVSSRGVFGFQAIVTILERHGLGEFNSWSEVAVFPAPNDGPEVLQSFGASVAIDGGIALVGAPDGRRVYAYESDSDGVWGLSQTISLTEESFGFSLDISGDRFVVGCPDANNPTPNEAGQQQFNEGGQVFVYERAGKGSPWIRTRDLFDFSWHAELNLSDPHYGECGALGEFGYAVALDGDLLAVGDPSSDGCNDATIWVTRAVEGAWPSSSVQIIPEYYIEDGSQLDFGSVLAVNESSGLVVAGLPLQGDPNVQPDSSGVARVYRYGSDWQLEAELRAPSLAPSDQFGSSVAVNGQVIAVGSPFHDHPYNPNPGAVMDEGSIYLFVDGHEPGCPPLPAVSNWGLLARRTATEPKQSGAFGAQVAMDGDTILTFQRYLNAFSPPQVEVLSGMTPMKSGVYQLLLQVDPHDQILESDEVGSDDEVAKLQSNIIASTDSLGQPLTVEFCVPGLDQPNLAVTSVELTPIEIVDDEAVGYVIADQTGASLTKAGLNVSLRMTGSFDGPLSGAYLTAEAVGLPGGTYPIQIWDPVKGSYENEFPLDSLSTGDERQHSLDVRFTGPATDVSQLPLNLPFTPRVTIHTPNLIVDVDGSNDAFELPAQNWTQIPVISCDFYEQYETSMGSGEIAVGINIEGSVGLFGDDGNGALASQPGHTVFDPDGDGILNIANQAMKGALGALDASADLTLFGVNLGELASFRVQIERDPTLQVEGFSEPGYGYIGTDVNYLNPIIPLGAPDVLMSWGPYDSTVIKEIEQLLPEGLTVTDDGGFQLEVEFSVDKEVEQKKVFFPGGFPVEVTAAATGEVGITFTVQVSNSVVFEVEPTLESGVSLSAAAGVCEILCVGAKGELTLVEDTFTIAAGVGLTHVTELNEITGEVTGEAICANACFVADNVIEMLDGRIYAFAITPWVDWCWEELPFGIWVPYPCKFYLKELQFDILKWDGLEFDSEIANVSEPLCSAQLFGGVDCSTVPAGDVCGTD